MSLLWSPGLGPHHFVNHLRLFPFPRAKISRLCHSVPAARPSPEPWVDALKEDVETEFNLTLVDDVKAQKDASLAAATTMEERAAIQREYDASMADIRAQARSEFQRRVEAERERRLQGNYDGKDALIAEQHTIMERIVRENVRREVSQSSTGQSSTQAQSQSQPQPALARPSQPIPIPVQRSRSRNGGPSGSIAARSVSNTSFPSFPSSSSSSSPRPFPTVRRDSITQHASPRLLPPPGFLTRNIRLLYFKLIGTVLVARLFILKGFRDGSAV